MAKRGSDVWAQEWGGGLSVLRGTNWRTYRADNSPLPGDWISALASSADGVWVATYGAGLARVRGATWTSFRRTNSGLPSDWLTCLVADGRGAVDGGWNVPDWRGWIAMDSGVARCRGSAGNEPHVTALPAR